jgi:Bacterial Ig-like domain (group 3)/FG-GAP-like repeat/FG-GAP repeat/EF hand
MNILAGESVVLHRLTILFFIVLIAFTTTRTLAASSSNAGLSASSIFLEAQDYASGGNGIGSFAAADVNGDGKLDLVVANGCVLNSLCSGQTAGIIGVLIGNGDGTFQSPLTYFTGSTKVYSVAVADVNGDGKADVVVGGACPNGDCMAGSTVSVLLGNGDGTFRTGASYGAVPSGSGRVVVADVNGDAKLDLIVAGGAIGVLLGNGDGSFQPEVVYSGGGDAADAVAVADVNGDGKPDLIASNQFMTNATPNGGVGVLIGNGDGTFQAAVPYYSGGQNARSVAVGDINGDGKPDIVVVNEYINQDTSSGGFGLLLGNGDGSFQPAVTYSTGVDRTISAVISDVDGNGLPDLLVSSGCEPNGRTDNCSTGVISVFLGAAGGAFQAPLHYAAGNAGGAAMAAIDVNGDGHLDLLVTNDCRTTGCIGVIVGNGDGTFQAPRIFPYGVYPDTSTIAADLNGDGKLDLVVANLCLTHTNCATGGVGVFLGNGDGSFQAPGTYGSGNFNANAVAIADVNRDGKPDVIVAKQCIGGCVSDTIGVMLGNGNGTFQPVVDYGSGGQNAHSVAVVDVNGDGNPDILVTNQFVTITSRTNGVVGVLLGKGDGTFRPAVVYPSGGEYSTSIAVADVNGDGKPDLLVANSATSDANSNGSLGILFGNGDGTFRSPVTYATGGGGANAVAIADLNRDGKLDLLVANQCGSTCASGTMGALLGNGDGTFQSPLVSVTPMINSSFAEPLAVADFDGDGKLDVASAVSNFLLLGNGDGTFQSPLFLGAGGSGIAAGDFDLDGKPDVAVSGFTILRNISPAPVRSATRTILTSTLNPSAYGQAVTLQAAVSTQSGSSPTGIVTFTDGGSTLGSVSLVNGSASLSVSAFAIGSHSISAAYSGDSSFSESSSALTQTVNRAGTTTAATVSPTPSVFGQSVAITATVTSAAGVPSGSVTFNDGATGLATGSLNSSGQDTFSTSALIAGSHTIAASYGGAGNFAGSVSNSVELTVNKASTTTSISMQAPNPSVAGQPVSINFTVNPVSPGAGARTGNVSVSDAAGDSCSAAVAAGTCSIVIPAAGTKTLKATYAGDSNFNSSTSASVTHNVTDFSIISTPTSQTLKAPQKATYKLTLAPLNGFAGTVSLSCAGLPATLTCTFNPVSVTLNGSSSATSTVTVQTSKTTPKGTYLVPLAGIYGTGNTASGGLTHTVKVTLAVQ